MIKQYRIIYSRPDTGHVTKVGKWHEPFDLAVFYRDIERLNRERPFLIRQVQKREVTLEEALR